jgi:predicted Zn-dependent protease
MAVLESVLEECSADEAQVKYRSSNGVATRFGDNAITQNIGGRDEEVTIEVAFGSRHGSATTNNIGDEALRKAVSRAEEAAHASPEDPEHVPVPAPQSYPTVPPRYESGAAEMEPADLADGVEEAVEVAEDAGCTASGLYEVDCRTRAIANSKGLYAFDRHSMVDFSTTVQGQSGSGFWWVNGESPRAVEPREAAERALETARATEDPQPIGRGDYTVVFEPQATFDLLQFMAFEMSAREADEGTTAFQGRVGEQIFDESINLATRVDDPDLPAPAFGRDGLAARNTTWVEDGELQRLRHSRYWAREKNTAADPLLFPLFMSGGDSSIEELVSDVERGLLVKRLWYIRFVDRKELLLTGLTRDGLFLIEDGQITEPVQNLRFNECPIVFLQDVTGLGNTRRIGPFAKVPAIRSEHFTFTSTTESV